MPFDIKKNFLQYIKLNIKYLKHFARHKKKKNMLVRVQM